MDYRIKSLVFCIFLGTTSAWIAGNLPAQALPDAGCRVVLHGDQVELWSPSFVFRLDTHDGLRARSWENRLSGRTISLGNGPELEVDIGLPDRPLKTPAWQVDSCQVKGAPVKQPGEAGSLVVTLTAKEPPLSAEVTYRWHAAQPVLGKSVRITNLGDRELNRLLNVRLGTYRTRAKTTQFGQDFPIYSQGAALGAIVPESERGRGFPLYLDDDFFVGLAHPAGWAKGKDGQVSLWQYPGARISPGKNFECMETVYGVSRNGGVRKAFVDYLRSRMRRVLRGHDKPYAIFEPFGGMPGSDPDQNDMEQTEQYILQNIEKLAQGQRETGYHFDYCSLEFWVDHNGDLKRFDPVRFPNGISKIRAQLDKLGTAPALWIDSSWRAWSIGGNPTVQNALNWGPDKDPSRLPLERVSFCRATEPIKSMYTDAFRYHIRHNGVRLLKFDNFETTCLNPAHEHLPGRYSTEPIVNAAIEFLHALDAECPDVILMLYWGYNSPWWLLHGDTVFDAGLGIEAATPGDLPTPYARDGVTQKLDQAQWRAVSAAGIPALGKDSLGVWLSDWPWNSQIGKERWQNGFVMDLCRGSLLAQPWSDTPWLSTAERKQMAEFIALLRARPACFGNPRFVVGSPWKYQPYGYCSTDGKRAFVALHNATWYDRQVPLELNGLWGLPDGKAWDIYRWYPGPAKLQGDNGAFGPKVSLALRPFAVVLLEIVPHGEPPSLDRRFESQPITTAFAEASRAIDIRVRGSEGDHADSDATWTVLRPAEAGSAGGAGLTVQKDGSVLLGGENRPFDTYTIKAQTNLTGITAVRLEALADGSLPMFGPGRSENGNFAISELELKASPKAHPSEAASVALAGAVADFSQAGWPVTAAIDGNPKTAWCILPQKSRPHTAIFHCRQPVGFSDGTTLEFTIRQETHAKHNLGRFRLSVTTDKATIAVPKPAEPRVTVLQGQLPASKTGGMLVICAQTSPPLSMAGPASFLTAKGKLGGRSIAWQPVLKTATAPVAWQAWRLAVAASPDAQPFELTASSWLPEKTVLAYIAYFLPSDVDSRQPAD